MDYIYRNHDVITGKEDLEHLYTFTNYPAYFSCTDAPQSEDVKADMCWHISRGSGCIQLNPCLPLSLIYKEGHSSSFVGKLWPAHHKAFAEFLAKYNDTKILEIGGGAWCAFP